MESYKLFTGTGVALVTPFKQGGIDFDALSKLIEHCIAGKVDFLVSLGTTGESVTLSVAEQTEILRFTKEQVRGRVKLIAGFGSNNTQQLALSLRNFDAQGYDGILSASPAYNKPTQEGIFQHYKYIAGHTDLPIVIYNVPGRTASNISAETTLRLARYSEQFVGIKEASGNVAQCMQIINGDKPAHFSVLSGDDNLSLPLMACGMDGLISVVANAYPAEYSKMISLATSDRFDAARKIHYSLMDLVDLLFVEGNPAGIKTVLCQMGICGDELRLPLVQVSEKTKLSLIAAMQKHAKTEMINS